MRYVSQKHSHEPFEMNIFELLIELDMEGEKKVNKNKREEPSMV